MYYYNSKFDVDVEDLILDFRAQQKNNYAALTSSAVNAAAERNFMNKISCGLTKKLLPYVKNTLDQMNYLGSLAFEREMDKETLAQMVERTINAAAKDMEEVDEISLDMQREGISRRALLYSFVEMIVLTELLFERRGR